MLAKSDAFERLIRVGKLSSCALLGTRANTFCAKSCVSVLRNTTLKREPNHQHAAARAAGES